MRDLADMLELEVARDKIISPYNPDERTASCHLYEDGWFDFSTGKGGDVIDLYRALTGANLGRAVNKLLEGSVRLDADPDRVVHKPVELPDLTGQFQHSIEMGRLEGGRRADWASRLPGVSPTHLGLLEINQLLAVWPNMLMIPHWHDGKVRGIKIRNADGTKSAVPGSTFACGLYKADPHNNRADIAVLVEGESDCWALTRHFIVDPVHVFALPGGAGLWKDAWLKDLEGYDTIYTAFDNDRAGRQATEKVRSAIGYGRWKELKVPTLFSDVRDAMAAGWIPKLS